MISSAYNVVAQGKHLTTINTTVETREYEQKIRPALGLLALPDQKFVTISDCYIPADLGTESQTLRYFNSPPFSFLLTGEWSHELQIFLLKEVLSSEHLISFFFFNITFFYF